MTFWYSERYWVNVAAGLKPMIISPLNPMLKHGVKTWAKFQIYIILLINLIITTPSSQPLLPSSIKWLP